MWIRPHIVPVILNVIFNVWAREVLWSPTYKQNPPAKFGQQRSYTDAEGVTASCCERLDLLHLVTALGGLSTVKQYQM